MPLGVCTTSSTFFVAARVALLGLPTATPSMKCVRSMSDASMRPPANPTLRHAESSIAVLAQ